MRRFADRLIRERKLNILYLVHYFLPTTAAGVTTREIIKMLLESGHKVTVVAPSTYAADESEMQCGNKRRLVTASTIFPPWLARRSKFASILISTFGHLSIFVSGLQIVRKYGPFNIILAQYHTTHLASLTSFVLSRLFKTPLIVKVHDVVPGSTTGKKTELIYSVFLSKLNRASLSHACVVLSGSNEFRRMLVDYNNINASKIELFPNTVSFYPSSTTSLAKQIQNRFDVNGKKVLLFLGETVRRGLEVLLKAVALINDPSLVVLVIGVHNKKPVELAEKLRIQDKVFFLGEVSHDQVAVYIDIADVCIGPLTSTSYTYGCTPRKVLEYMARSKPVIVAENTVTKDLVIDKVSALVVNSNDETQVASAITNLLCDDAFSATLGESAHEIVVNEFSSVKLREKLDGIFTRMCEP